MKNYIALAFIFACCILDGQVTVGLSTPAPSAPTVSAFVVGNPGNAQYNYWVITSYPAGSVISNDVLVQFAPASLTSQNYVQVNWSGMAGATGYDVVKIAAPGIFSGTCSACLLASGMTGTTLQDTGGALTSYTAPSLAAQGNGSLYINTRDYLPPQIRQVVNGVDSPLTGPTPASTVISISPTGKADQIAINTAYQKLSVAGGGTIVLSAGTFVLSASITPMNNVALIGIPPGLNNFDGNSNDYWTFSGTGTLLQGTGAFDCIARNTTPATSPSGYVTAGALLFVSFRNFGLTNCLSGIHIGAQNVPGLYYSSINNVYASGNSAWGFNLDNFSLDSFSSMYSVSNITGDMRFASTVEQATYQPGNSTFTQLYASPLNNFARGIVFEANGADSLSQSGLNSITVTGLQANRFRGTSITQTVTPANASTAVAVTDLSVFRVGMPFWVTATADGYTANRIYFILTVSGATGAGSITAATTRNGTAISGTAATALTLRTYGFPNIEITGSATAASSKVTGSLFTGIDMEGASTVGLYIGNTNGVTAQIQVMALSGGVNQLAYRAANATMMQSYLNMTADVDSASANSQWFGSRGTMNQLNPPGMYNDTTFGNSITLTNVTGNVPDLYVRSPSGGEFWYPNGVSMGEHVFTGNQSNSTATLGAFFAGVLTFNGAASQTFTLPPIDNGGTPGTSILGLHFRIQNASQTNSLAIATSSSQTLNNISGKTTTTVAVNSTLDCVAAATASAAVLYWSCFYVVGSALP